jgi:parallel beta-helix repeat protein
LAWEIFNSTIQNNRLEDNGIGILIHIGSWNTIRRNTCINNTQGSIHLGIIYLTNTAYINNNTISGNYFIDNWTLEEFMDKWKIPALDQGVNNTWYSDEYGGNYWTWVKGPDMDRDGIVDYPFIINGTAGSIDKYPLSHPEPKSKNQDEFDFIPGVIGAITILIFILMILAGAHKIRFHVKNDPDLNGE